MPNTLGNYDPLFYAAEALIQLEKALGLAGRVYRGYDKDPQQLGSTINLRRPTSFTAQSMPISSGNTSDLNGDSVAITLDQWYGVQFGLTDKELNYTQEQIIREHIRPAAVAVADQIDMSLNARYVDVPWFYDGQATISSVVDITGTRRILFDNKVPMNDLHMEISGEREAGFLALDTFNRADASGSAQTQLRGTLGEKFGFEIFANQNVRTHTGGNFAVTGSVTVSATVTVGQTSIALAGATISGSVVAGDIITVGTQKYAVAAAATVTTNAVTVTINPKARATIASGAVATVRTGTANNKQENLAFHRNAFALAMAPLSELGNQLGAKVVTLADPITGLAIRSTMWYDAINAKVYVRLDALWGIKTLDPDLAARYNA
jgi:hypothetical protein